MTEKDKQEAGEKMSQLDKILQGWKDEQTEDIAYQVPLNGKPMSDVGKCRVVFEFASLSDAEEMVADSYNHDDDGSVWHEDADPESIAKYLASDEDED